ncbi:dTMP kinase [Bailinhaonella thermotolerans]|uniref:Thymidylate kinase n=1 Tax=Bailinhaonella thermotolerans TaxID=1070861 RepID=A0A3A4B1A5_9ACTN|nr:dTMP kinase [Bailinhaonella thermotolerans]RJL31883.1 dTMP kinase [Bailinhaonella thermotolerans]
MTASGRATRRKQPHVLSFPSFRRLWVSMSLCSLGDWLNFLALQALAVGITARSSYTAMGLAVGGVLAVKMLPAIILGPVAGAVADRFDRRMTMVVGDLLRFALVFSIPLVGSLQWLLIATFLVECVNLFWVPAKEATVPNLVPRDKLAEANQFGLLVTYGSAPVAGALFAVLSLISGPLSDVLPVFENEAYLALYINALAFLASSVIIFTTRGIPRGGGRVSTPSVLKQIFEGWRFVGATPLVRGLVIGMVGAFAAGGAVIGVATLYVKALEGGEAAVGVVFGAVFLGMALGMFFGPRMLRELSRRRMFGLAIVAAGLALALVALIHNLVIVVFLTVALGLCAGAAWITGYTMLGMEVRDEIRGRTFAFLQSLVRVTLLLVVSVAPVLAALVGKHELQVGSESVYTFDGTNAVLLVAALVAVVVGSLAFRQMDDRRGVPLLADLLAAVRGEQYVTETEDQTRGLFIVFEGVDGSGKTTQSRLLGIWLRDQGYDVVTTREPGATKVGMRLRAILLDSSHQGLSPRSEALLYAADRAEHVDNVILPALRRGAMVVSDRYVDSSLAYQGAGRVLEMRDVARVNAWATGGLVPDLTVLCDLPPEVGRGRFASPADRIESEPQDFHERVRREFRAIAAADPDRYLVVDATQDMDVIARQIQDRVREILPDPVAPGAEDITHTMPAIRD